MEFDIVERDCTNLGIGRDISVSSGLITAPRTSTFFEDCKAGG